MSNELDVQNEWEENTHTHTLLLVCCTTTTQPTVFSSIVCDYGPGSITRLNKSNSISTNNVSLPLKGANRDDDLHADVEQEAALDTLCLQELLVVDLARTSRSRFLENPRLVRLFNSVFYLQSLKKLKTAKIQTIIQSLFSPE